MPPSEVSSETLERENGATLVLAVIHESLMFVFTASVVDFVSSAARTDAGAAASASPIATVALSLLIRWGQLPGRGLNGGLNGRAECALLISAQHPCDQLLAARIGEQPDQPPQQIVHDKDHVSSLPLLRPAVQTWCK